MTRRVTALVLLSLAALLLHGRFVVPYVMEREAQEAQQRAQESEELSDEDRATLTEQLQWVLTEWRGMAPRVQIIDGPNALTGRRPLPVPPRADNDPRTWQSPAEALHGLVLTCDPFGQRVTLQVGAGAGIAVGDTLVVYRMRPSALVVGIVRVLEVRGSDATARILFDRTDMEVGDQVCSEAFLKR